MLGHVSEGLLSCRGSRKQLPEKTVEKSGNKNPNKSDGPNELCAGFGADHSARCQLQLQPPSIRVFSIYPRLTGAIIPALLLRANHPPHFRGCWPSAAKITLFHPRFPRVFYKRSFQSHRSSQGEVSLIKMNKTPFFPPNYCLAFSQHPQISPVFMEERRKLRHRDCGQDWSIIPTSSIPIPGAWIPLVALAECWGRALLRGLEHSWDFPAPWSHFSPMARVGDLGMSEGWEQWDNRRGAASALQN